MSEGDPATGMWGFDFRPTNGTNGRLLANSMEIVVDFPGMRFDNT